MDDNELKRVAWEIADDLYEQVKSRKITSCGIDHIRTAIGRYRGRGLYDLSEAQLEYLEHQTCKRIVERVE